VVSQEKRSSSQPKSARQAPEQTSQQAVNFPAQFFTAKADHPDRSTDGNHFNQTLKPTNSQQQWERQ